MALCVPGAEGNFAEEEPVMTFFRFAATNVAKNLLASSAMGCLLVAAQPCLASTLSDPANDFNDTYIGPTGDGLDILQFSLTRDVDNFYISAFLAGVPGTTSVATTPSRYVVGVDRGAGAYHFGAGIRPDILVDSAINLLPATISGNVTFIGPPDIITPLPLGAVTINGNTISGVIPISMLPSLGLDPNDYRFYLWSRINIAAPTPLYYGIADFAGAGPLTAAVPEPETWALMLLGFFGIGVAIGHNSKTHRLARLVARAGSSRLISHESAGASPTTISIP